jgi:putative ABC transport system permease protein
MAIDTEKAPEAPAPVEKRPEKPTKKRAKVKRPTLFREVARNLRRRKLRSFLTLSGIALGAFALTVMGSLAENFNSSIGSLREFLEEQVLVRAKGSSVFFPVGHLPADLMDDYEAIDGVEIVVPRITVTVEDNAQGGFGPPQMIFGIDIERALRSPIGDLDLSAGRRLRPDDRWKIVLGSNLARQLGEDGRLVRPDDTVTIRGHDFEVVGVGKATGTPVDDFATASIADTRVIAKENDPFLDVDRVVDEFSIYPEPGVDPNDLADRIEGVSDQALIFPPEASAQELQQITAIFGAIILGSALVALLVGGVAIINTMVFSVTERTREIGIKKAIGASKRDILREFLSEAAILSFTGGILGGLVGWGFTGLINAASRDEGVIAFTVTPRLALFVFVLALVIGAGAGFLPARRAAKIDPVRALRTLG